jgi:hypothetical protein
LCACASRTDAISHPVPDKEDDNEPVLNIDVNNIKETQDGISAAYLPNWLISYMKGGIAEVEKLDLYQNRYVFIGKSRGANFIALNKWAGNFTVIQDFPRLAAVRIEKKLNSAASRYPDDEYGEFYEALVKKAFSAEYLDAVKEQTYWIKTTAEVYEFYVFLSMEKSKMQSIIRTMMTDSLATVTPTRAQNPAINRLRQVFFEGF